MRGMSKAAKAEAYDELKSELDVYAQLMFLTFNGVAPDLKEKAIEYTADTDGPVSPFYEFHLYGIHRANGGVIVQVYHSQGETDASVEAFLFDDWLRMVRTYPLTGFLGEIRMTADRLSQARAKRYAEEQASWKQAGF